MFKNNIPKLAEEKGIINAFQLAKALNISYSVVVRLWNGEFSKVGIDTLHRLCDLFQCQISDFLYWDGNKLGE